MISTGDVFVDFIALMINSFATGFLCALILVFILMLFRRRGGGRSTKLYED
jgi:hypothetical protein